VSGDVQRRELLQEAQLNLIVRSSSSPDKIRPQLKTPTNKVQVTSDLVARGAASLYDEGERERRIRTHHVFHLTQALRYSFDQS
jgi:hypothetical protein